MNRVRKMKRSGTQKILVRLFAAALCAVFFLGMVPAAYAAETSGRCGDNLTWELTDGTLIITGSGDMYDYPEADMAPWYPLREQIEWLSLPEGLTSVGDLAFYECSRIQSIRVPDSVREIGWFSFAKCSGVTMLHLGAGLRTIGESAFREMSGLSALRLPQGLESIGEKAFFRCESLTSIVIPSSVTEMGNEAFCYCFSLVHAEIQASIHVLPEWTFYGCGRLASVALPDEMEGVEHYAFYGCDSLSDVEYHGSSANAIQIEQDIARDRGSFGSVTEMDTGNTSSSTVYEDTDNGSVGITSTTTQTDNAHLGGETTVQYPGSVEEESTSSSDVTITVENDKGWEEVEQELKDIVDSSDKTHVDVYIKDDSTLTEEDLKDFANQNVTVTVHTTNGSSWQVDLSQTDMDSAQGVDLSYERLPASQEQKDQLGTDDAYRIVFESDAQVNAEVKIKLPPSYAYQNAYLYQQVDQEVTRLQASMVDTQGYAHFYVANISAETEYLVGINVPGEQTGDVLIPSNMHEAFDITDTMAPIDYVITGRKSSWGMDINQVTWIMVGVLGGSVVLVGVVVYLLNKRKLSKGYVPDLDEYEI